MRVLLLFFILCGSVQGKCQVNLNGRISPYEVNVQQVIQLFRPYNSAPQSWYAAKEDEILINADGNFSGKISTASAGVYTFKMPDGKTVLVYIGGPTSSVSLSFRQDKNSFVLTSIDGNNAQGSWLANEMKEDLSGKIKAKDNNTDLPSFWNKIEAIESDYTKKIESLADQALIDGGCKSFLHLCFEATLLNSIYYYTQNLLFAKGPEKQQAKLIIDSVYKRYNPLNPAYLGVPSALSNAYKYVRYINESKGLAQDNAVKSVDSTWSAIAFDYSVPSQLPEPYREAQLGDFILLNYFYLHNPDAKKAILLFYKQYPASTYMPVFLEALASEKSEQQENISSQSEKAKTADKAGVYFISDSVGLFELIAKHFKGKMVLIDCWATWCKYCIIEFPAYKQYDGFMKENNIVKLFVSFDKTPTDKLWQPMVQNKDIEGQHVIVNDKIEKDIFSITHTKSGEPLPLPRYILLGPEGKVLSSDFARPSSQEFFKQLELYTKKYKS